MDYEKLYKETIDKLRKLHNDWGSTQNRAAKEIESVFPELRESEDERIRKELIEFIRTLPCTISVKNEFFAWLEKHGEQKSVEWHYPYGKNETVDKLMAIAECLEMDEDCLYNGYTGTECVKFLRDLARKQVECKPAWNEDDEQYLQKAIECAFGNGYLSVSDWLKSLKDRVQPQPKQEWSEDDETKFRDVIRLVEQGAPVQQIRDHYTNWLKSLKDRFQLQPKQEWSEEDNLHLKNAILAAEKEWGLDSFTAKWLKSLKFRIDGSQWTPSEDQMIALRWVLNNIPYNYHKEVISQMVEELKKL